MDEHSRDEEKQDEPKLPEDRVEDLEPSDEDADEVQGGLNYTKIEYD